MTHITLVTGGARSGKSRHAQHVCESIPGERLFIATCPPVDDEMTIRIERHKQERAGQGWATAEEPIALDRVFATHPEYTVYLVDCLSLWASNMLIEMDAAGVAFTEDMAHDAARQVITACEPLPGRIVFVTNEVGGGIVPENALARRYRDILGRINQTIAAAANDVVLVVCGVPLTIKQS